MQEPKKYTAREAMHWMVDHPGETMLYDGSLSREFWRFFRCEFQRFTDSVWETDEPIGQSFYIRAEYKAWQAALKAEAERISSLTNEQEGTRKTVAVGSECIGQKAEAEKAEDIEPKEGESLYKYMKRDGGDYKKQSELEDSRQRWIESYVQREIAKAEEER